MHSSEANNIQRRVFNLHVMANDIYNSFNTKQSRINTIGYHNAYFEKIRYMSIEYDTLEKIVNCSYPSLVNSMNDINMKLCFVQNLQQSFGKTYCTSFTTIPHSERHLYDNYKGKNYKLNKSAILYKSAL